MSTYLTSILQTGNCWEQLPFTPICQIAGLTEARPLCSSACHRASCLTTDGERSAILHALFAPTGLKLQSTRTGPFIENLCSLSCSGTDSPVYTGSVAMDCESTFTVNSLPHLQSGSESASQETKKEAPRAREDE